MLREVTCVYRQTLVPCHTSDAPMLLEVGESLLVRVGNIIFHFDA